MRKLLVYLYIAFTFFSCQMSSKKHINFLPNVEGIKITKIVNANDENLKCVGSYTYEKDTIITQYKYQSKYSLLVMKLNNIDKNLKFKYSIEPKMNDKGFYSVFNENGFEVFYNLNINPKIKINSINFNADKTLEQVISNDTIKSFYSTFNEFSIKTNTSSEKVIYGNTDYFNKDFAFSNFLFYKVKDKMYIFIMSSFDENKAIEKNILHNFLFPKSN